MSTTARPKKNDLLHIQTLLQKLIFRSAYKMIYHKERHPYIPFRYAYIMLFFNVFLDKITMESEFPIIPIMQSIGITTEQVTNTVIGTSLPLTVELFSMLISRWK